MGTIYKKNPKDKIRINIHGKEYWIKEFESNGFKFKPQKLNRLIKDYVKIMLSIPTRETIKFKIAKILYQKGGYFGENIVLLTYKILSPSGILYFTKGD